jgi:DNA-binding transcriptional LysR family regulator
MKNPLDSRQLSAFYHVARTSSFTQGARAMNLSQSAVSRAVQSLEDDVGCRLLDRLGKTVTLTLAGEQLLHFVEKIFRDMNAARGSLAQLGKWGRGRLRLGASIAICQYVLPGVLREFRESFPDYEIAIQPGDAHELTDDLVAHRVDLALTIEPRVTENLEFVPVFEDELLFLVAPNHPWAVQGGVTRSEIPTQNYIRFTRGSVTFDIIEEYFRRERMVLKTFMELGSMEAIKELVKLGLGVGIMAPWVATEELRQRSLIALPLGRRKLQRRWGVLHWKGKRLNLAEETFIGLCRSATQGLQLQLHAA